MLMRLVVNTLAALLGSYIIPGVYVSSVGAAILFVLILGILNATLGNLMRLAGCLLNLVTFGFFNWIINAAVILISGNIINGIAIDGWLPAILLAFIMSLVSSFLLKQKRY